MAYIPNAIMNANYDKITVERVLLDEDFNRFSTNINFNSLNIDDEFTLVAQTTYSSSINPNRIYINFNSI